MPSLYVHVPFCVRKCDYCAFYSVAPGDRHSSLVGAYLEGLELEIGKRKEDAPTGVSSLFLGGGTPTYLADAELGRLLDILNQGFTFLPGAEKTSEANPGTLSESKLFVMKSKGLNRISLGVQSLDDKLLKQIGRIHTAAQVRESVRQIRAAGFNNLNLDLMFGLPGQGLRAWQESLEEALSFGPEHLSVYGLMLEEDTPLGEYYLHKLEPMDNPCLPDMGGGQTGTVKGLGELADSELPDDELQAEMYAWARERLARAGYLNYETSNFAKPGYECRHNLCYWRGEEYLGLGPSAVSFVGGARWKNIEDVRKYGENLQEGKSLVAECENLTMRQLMAERVILGLRLQEGANLEGFRKDFGCDLTDVYATVLERYLSQEILFIKEDRLCLKQEYSFVANSILADFV